MKNGIQAVVVSLKDLEIGREAAAARRPYFTKEQAQNIINAAKEPYQTMFTLAWCTGLRAGEILALTVEDLNFTSRTINVNKSADDNNRSFGQTKTETSTALLPMSSLLTTVLQNYLEKRWQANPKRLLFPNRRGTLTRRRDNVVKYADIWTTLQVYAHVIPQSQRDAMEAVSIGTVPVMEQEAMTNG